MDNIKRNHKKDSETAALLETNVVPQIIMPEEVRIWLGLPPTHGQCVRPQSTTNRIKENAQSGAGKLASGDFQLSAERISDMLWSFQHWRLKTQGKRVECQRHHLGVLLSKWTKAEASDLIALSLLGKRGGFFHFSEIQAEMPEFLESRSVADVMFEDIGRFEENVVRGLKYVGQKLAGWVGASLTPERASTLVGEITGMLRVKEPDFMKEEVCDVCF